MGLELLAQYRIQRGVNALQDIRQAPGAVKLWSGRIRDVDAEDGEILAEITQRVVAADIIPDGGKAVVGRRPPITLHETHIPNIKRGLEMKQEFINLLLRIQNGAGIDSDYASVDTAIARDLGYLEEGVRQRQEMMIVGMLCDDLDYDRLGVKLSNITWRMPSDLKVTVSTPWSTAASATPIADILAVKNVAQHKYGIIYNRITMSLTAFNYMINTTEFHDLAGLYSQLVLPSSGAFPVNDTTTMQKLASIMLAGMEIEFNDSQFTVEDTYGVDSYIRYQPENKVLLTNSQYDGDTGAWDFANGIVTETVVGSLIGAGGASRVVGGFNGPQRGPVGYVTGDQSLNPPSLEMWCVKRGFPRKFQRAVNACMTVYS
jgi:hypothetical protein